MGRLAAQLFAREGAEIVAIDITEGPLKETVSSVEVEGGSIIGVPADITVSESVREAVRAGVRAFGKLNVLYNNADIFPDDDTSVVETAESVFQRVIDVNLKGVFLCCKYRMPAQVKTGGRSVIHIASFVASLVLTVP